MICLALLAQHRSETDRQTGRTATERQYSALHNLFACRSAIGKHASTRRNLERIIIIAEATTQPPMRHEQLTGWSGEVDETATAGEEDEVDEREAMMRHVIIATAAVTLSWFDDDDTMWLYLYTKRSNSLIDTQKGRRQIDVHSLRTYRVTQKTWEPAAPNFCCVAVAASFQSQLGCRFST